MTHRQAEAYLNYVLELKFYYSTFAITIFYCSDVFKLLLLFIPHVYVEAEVVEFQKLLAYIH